ncbi:MAG: hypothetical protein CMD29_02425 [Flavobacteriales bacterium]|nr:hypothetical protein [Flavobacteriales bacterium]|tara:strand:- start:298 stop:867 length:570 start_codon:yes stop_codon:yes gene_type:complete
MKSNDQIKLINDTINKAKENLKPLGYNLLFWGIYINVLSAIHYFFGPFIFQKMFHVWIYWVAFPLLGMIYMTRWNIKRGIKIGYETIIGRVMRIIWAVFGLGWVSIIIISMITKSFHPTPLILFLLGLVLIMNGLIIKFKPLTAGGIVIFMFIYSLISNPEANYLIVNMVAVTFGMLIPGFFLYKMKTN